MRKRQDEGTVDLSLTVNVSLDGKTTSIPLLRNATIPEPSCHNTDLSYALPGDGTVEGFARALGNSVGESAVELVLSYLGIKVKLKITCFSPVFFFHVTEQKEHIIHISNIIIFNLSIIFIQEYVVGNECTNVTTDSYASKRAQ